MAMRHVRDRCCLLFLMLSVLLLGPLDAAAQLKPADGPPEAPNLLKGREVESYQLALLELGWLAATSHPIHPNIKMRARAEEKVVRGALAIGQPQLAWEYSNKVVNWRRGLCYAEIAHYLIANDQRADADYFLYQALKHGKDSKQAWRGAKVRARVAAAKTLLGREAAAVGLVEQEDVKGQGERLSAKAALISDEEFDAMLARLDRMVGSIHYESILVGLQGYADLYKRFYADKARRALLHRRVSDAPDSLPGMNRFMAIMELIKAAEHHGGKEDMAVLLDEATTLFESFRWDHRSYPRMLADLARYRALAGQNDIAHELLERGIAYSGQWVEQVPSLHRANLYRPYAEVYAVLGEKSDALAMYKRVVELGSINMNRDPRVSDITETCVSMALHGVQPDDTLLATIEEIVGGLRQQ